MRTIPSVNNPPFRPAPGMATVGFLKICGSLEKMYMNPHLENSKKKIKRHAPWPCRLAEAHTCTCTCTRQVRSSRTCCCLSCCCEETTGALARASSLSVFLSRRTKYPLHISRSDAPIGLRCSRRQFGTKPSDVASAHHSH